MSLFSSYREWKNKRDLKKLLKNPYILEIIRRDINSLSERKLMDYLDGRRINHCFNCSSTDSLRKTASGYSCDKHFLKKELEHAIN